MPDGKTIHNNNNGYTYIGNANNQLIQFANYADIAKYIGGAACKFATSELTYNNVTTSINQAFSLPTINSNLCILYVYLTASFTNDSTTGVGVDIQTNNNRICRVSSQYYTASTAEKCNMLIYDTINNYGCIINTDTSISTQIKVTTPFKLIFDNTYSNTIKHIYARCSLLYLA